MTLWSLELGRAKGVQAVTTLKPFPKGRARGVQAVMTVLPFLSRIAWLLALPLAKGQGRALTIPKGNSKGKDKQ